MMDLRGVKLGGCRPIGPSIPKRDQKLIIFDGPDGCGKTNISQGLSAELKVPYFKFSGEGNAWRAGTFRDHLVYGEAHRLELIRQTKVDVIIDRGYPSEWVYSKVFRRETDERLLEHYDREYAKLGTYVVVPLRRDYTKNREDELVPQDRLQEIHERYLEFVGWSRCSTVVLYVDDFNDKLTPELEALRSAFHWGEEIRWATNVVLERRSSKKDNTDLFSPPETTETVELKSVNQKKVIMPSYDQSVNWHTCLEQPCREEDGHLGLPPRL